jgi:LEA14-like dessication related protein
MTGRSASAFPTRPRRIVVAALLAAVPFGAACASFVKEPRVALAEVSVESLSLSGATVQVQLDVENPNGFGLDAKALEYTLFFQPGQLASPRAEGPEGGIEQGGEPDVQGSWRTLATGRTAEPVTLPSNRTVRVPVSIPFRFRDLEEAAVSLLRDGTLRYRFEGAFTVGSPVGDIRVPFDRTGLLDL